MYGPIYVAMNVGYARADRTIGQIRKGFKLNLTKYGYDEKEITRCGAKTIRVLKRNRK